MTEQELIDYMKDKFVFELDDDGDVYRLKGGAWHPVGAIRNDGYIHVSIKGKLYMLHRLVWLHYTGAWPKGDLDHIDRDRSNNRYTNLRDVSRSQNSVNSNWVEGASNVIHHTDHYRAKPYQAIISRQRKRVFSKYFATMEEALAAVAAHKATLEY